MQINKLYIIIYKTYITDYQCYIVKLFLPVGKRNARIILSVEGYFLRIMNNTLNLHVKKEYFMVVKKHIFIN